MDEFPIIVMPDTDHAITLSAAHDIPKIQNGTHHLDLAIDVAEEAGHLQSSPSFYELDDRTHKRRIYIAASSGDWSEASSYVHINPHWWRIPLTALGITALHAAVIMEQTSFVEKLVECMDVQDMEICMADGNTAFCLAAITGNVKIVKVLFAKNPRLLWIRGQKNMLPIQLASSAGHIPMTQFLFQKTQEDLHNNQPFEDVVKLFFFTITNNIYTVASKLLDCYPKLATIENEEGLTPLQILAQFSLCKEAIGHQDIVRSLFEGMEKEKESIKSVQLSKAMFNAARSGNIMILEFLLKDHPNLLFEVDSKNQRSLLHIAILYRQESVYRLILSKGAFKNVMIQLVDSDGNNVLHLAGKSAESEERFRLSTHHVLMRSEERWFKRVEKIVPPAMKTKKNKEGWTPKELFYESHKKLHKESIAGLINVANTLVVVATLIITIGITAGMTIPIEDIDSTHTPVFPRKTWYTIFFLSIAFGTSLCGVSMLFYASAILPTSWEPREESVHLRQTKLLLGNGTLFACILSMLMAVVCMCILVFEFLSNWILYFVAGLCFVGMSLYATLDYKRWRSGMHSVLTYYEVRSFTKVAKILMDLWPIRKIYQAKAKKLKLVARIN